MMPILPILELVFASIYLYFLQFLSSMSYSFPSTGLLLPWLNLSFGISDVILNGIFKISLSDSLLLLYKIQLISEY